MPTTKKSISIGVTCTNLSTNEYVKITNLTSGGTIRAKVVSGEAIGNPANSDLTWNDGDVISVESQGRYVASSSSTISKGGARVTLTLSAADDSPAVSL